MPVELPIGYDRPPTIREELQRYVRFELSREASRTGEFETFEEADDFEPEDGETDWSSEYELTELQEEEPVSLDGDPDSSVEDSSPPAQGGPSETPAEEPAAQHTGNPESQ